MSENIRYVYNIFNVEFIIFAIFKTDYMYKYKYLQRAELSELWMVHVIYFEYIDINIF